MINCRKKVRLLGYLFPIMICLLMYRIGNNFFNQDNSENIYHAIPQVIDKGKIGTDAPVLLPIVQADVHPVGPDVHVEVHPNVLIVHRVESPEKNKDDVGNNMKTILSKPGRDLIENATLPSAWTASEELLERLAARRQHVREVCRRDGLDTPNVTYKVNSWEFLINDEHHLIWCNVFKAASSTWMWNFNLLAGYSERYLLYSKKSPVELARKRYIRPSPEHLELAMKSIPQPLSFMITRHPFLRLVSAYRNKILTGNSLYIPLFRKIYKLYEQYGPPVPRIPKNGAPSSSKRKPTSPSFSQFVQYILIEEKNKRVLDMHWIPQSRFCTPCLVDFSVFVKTETLDEDGNYIIFTAGIDKVIKPKINNRSATGSTESVAKELMCQLTDKQVNGLLELYKYDLELFQYESASYRNDCSLSSWTESFQFRKSTTMLW